MIKNFTEDDLIYSSESSMIIHKRDGNQDRMLCLKVLNDEFPSSDQSWYFENEFNFSNNINCNSIRKALGQNFVENHKGIVFEYISGSDLGKYLSENKLPQPDLLKIAVNLAHALTDLQKENIIHNNLSPGNILIEKDTGRIYLIDTQIAARNSLTLEDTNNHILRKADLSYVAPEQTGRINRQIDHRTDLYSLGAVLYELFTGRVPFDYDDPAELIYAHLAKTPISPAHLRADIPPAVTTIVLKLLAKNAEDRYQSALGVYHDLDYCIRHGADLPVAFVPGQNDFSGKLFMHPTLYGKEHQYRKLVQLFENSASGGRNMLLVSGYSGCGKTALIAELPKTVNERKGFFISGKFEPFHQDTPYSAFVQAFNELVNYLLKQDRMSLAEWRSVILTKLGTLGKVITDLVPELETIIGKQPELPKLKGPEFQNRFNYVIGNFIKAIASEEHPLVIFIDDLQWADSSSLNLFDIVINDIEARYVMLIGAFRNYDISGEHPLNLLLDKLAGDTHVHKIEVANLKDAEVKKMVDELLRSGQDNSAELAQLVYAKTKGNPFYIHRFLLSIYDEGNLFFDFDRKQWKWRSEEIMQMNVSGNVADLMTSTIRKLPAKTIDILKVAACLGTRFDLHKLSISTNLEENALQGILQIAMAEGLIISAASQYKFAHDNIQHAIYSLISDEEQKQYHLKIAQVLSADVNEPDVNEHIFDLVNHWNNAADLVHDQATRDYIANLNLLAGKKARTSAAYQPALLYFEKGLQLLSPKCWEDNYVFTLQLFDEASEMAFQCGEMDRAEHLVTTILSHARGLMDAIKAHEIKIQKLIAGNHQDEAIALGLELLQKFDIRFPAKPGKLATISGLIRTKLLLKNKPSLFFEQLPLMTDPGKLAACRILSELLSAGYFAAPELVPLLIFKLVDLSVKNGLSPNSPFAFAALGYILSAYMGQVEQGIRFGEIALNISKKLKAAELAVRVHMTFNVFLIHWKKKLTDINEELENAYRMGLEAGDNEYTSYLAQNTTYNAFYSGIHLQKIADKSELLDSQIVQFRQEITIIRLRIFRQSIFNLINITRDPDIFSDPVLNEQEIQLTDSPKNYIYFQNLYLQKMVLAIIFNRYSEAFRYSITCEKYQDSIKGSVLDPVFYFYQSLAIASVYGSTDARKKPELLKKLESNVKRLKKYESLCKENYRHKRMLIEAELHKILGNGGKARNLYDSTIKVAVENHLIQDEAIAWERTGQYYIAEKHGQVAAFYVDNALAAYQKWGADAKVAQMSEYYAGVKIAAPKNNSGTYTKGANDLHNVDIDMATIIKVSTALSGEIILSKLLKKLMEILLENAGADQGCLILEKNTEMVIEAEIKAGMQEVKILQSTPLSNCNTIAKSVVNYVALKREAVLLDNALESPLFGDDEYIRKQQSKSILCAPLMNKGALLGIIYLSNDITAGTFTKKRLDFIKLLSGQIAISIENALFYDKLEQHVEERTRELQLEKKKSDNLLLNILPKEVADELKETGISAARYYEHVTVLFTDFVNFTRAGERMSPQGLIDELHTCFKAFDEITGRFGIEKIKTIGDAYLAVAGLPTADPNHAENAVRAAIEINKYMQERRSILGDNTFDIRIGIHSGSVVAGIVGVKKFAFDIWGDTVNTAARMEQCSESGKINISQTTYELVKEIFNCSYRGEIDAKGKGQLKMYYVE